MYKPLLMSKSAVALWQQGYEHAWACWFDMCVPPSPNQTCSPKPRSVVRACACAWHAHVAQRLREIKATFRNIVNFRPHVEKVVNWISCYTPLSYWPFWDWFTENVFVYMVCAATCAVWEKVLKTHMLEILIFYALFPENRHAMGNQTSRNEPNIRHSQYAYRPAVSIKQEFKTCYRSRAAGTFLQSLPKILAVIIATKIKSKRH